MTGKLANAYFPIRIELNTASTEHEAGTARWQPSAVAADLLVFVAKQVGFSRIERKSLGIETTMRPTILHALVLLALMPSAGCTSHETRAAAGPGDVMQRDAYRVPSAASGKDAATIASSLMRIPFEKNIGQFDSKVAFMLDTPSGATFVTGDGKLVHRLMVANDESNGMPGSLHEAPNFHVASFTESLGGAAVVSPSGLMASPVRISRLQLGDSTAPQPYAEVPAFEQIDLGEPWAGIHMTLSLREGGAEKWFTVAPGSSVERIRVEVDGLHLSSGPGGSLQGRTGLATVELTAPQAWQDSGDGSKIPVDVEYRILEDGAAYGFALGGYDRERAVTIDPMIRATYLGGSGYDEPRGLAIDQATGKVFVAGVTDSKDLPSNSAIPFSENADGFVARFNAELTALERLTYVAYPGGQGEILNAIVLHGNQVFVAGNFDLGPGGDLSDVLAASLNLDLNNINWSAWVDGGDNDFVAAAAVSEALGQPTLYVGGLTLSEDMPNTDGRFSEDCSGACRDAFVMAIVDGNVQFSTYLGVGGEGLARISAMTFDLLGRLTVAGELNNEQGSGQFPITTGGYGGHYDVFVTQLDPFLTTVHQSLVWGGQNEEKVRGIATGDDGGIYVTGYSKSEVVPSTAQGAQPFPAGGANDAFLLRVQAENFSQRVATFFGTNNADAGNQVAIEGPWVYLAGDTESGTMPGTAQAPHAVGMGPVKAFLARFSADLGVLDSSTYLGFTEGTSQAGGMDVHPQLGVYVTGWTNSTNNAHTIGNHEAEDGAQLLPAGGSNDGFVVRMPIDLRKDSQALPFNFVTKTKVNLNTLYTDGPRKVSGINVYQPVSFSSGGAGKYCISSENDCSCDIQPWTSANGASIGDEQYMCVRHTSAGTQNATVQSTITVAGRTATFTTTTADTTPDAFSLGPMQDHLPLVAYATSASAKITGINADADIGLTSIVGTSQYCVSTLPDCPCDIRPWGLIAGKVSNNQYVCVRHVTPNTHLTERTTSINVGGTTASLVSRTSGPDEDNKPDELDFFDQPSVPRATLMTSNPSPLTGFDVPIPIDVSGGAYCVSSSFGCDCDVAELTTHPGLVEAGDYVCAFHTSAGTSNTSTFTTVRIGLGAGRRQATFSTTTAMYGTVLDTFPDPFFFYEQSGVPLSSVRISNSVPVLGIASTTGIFVEEGEYLVSEDGSCAPNAAGWTDVPGVVAVGQHVCARHISSSAMDAETYTKITIGGAVGYFVSTTMEAPDGYVFADSFE